MRDGKRDDTPRPDRASEWLVALLEAPVDERLLADFEAWLAADPANATDWSEVRATYDLIGRVAPRHVDDGVDPPAAAVLPAAAATAPRRRRRLAAAAAAAALAASLAVALLPGLLADWGADFATGTGETLTVHLENGDLVHLGPDSAIAVGYEADRRRVELQRGQAFFEVGRDPVRPFSVAAGTVEATVLGTAFDVSRGAAGVDVEVGRGAVRVSRTGGVPAVSERLGPGDRISVPWSGAARRGRGSPDEVAAWRDGLLIAKHRRVDAVLEDIGRYYGGVILVPEYTLAGQPTTGVYRLADPVAAVAAIARAHDARVYRLTPWLILLTTR